MLIKANGFKFWLKQSKKNEVLDGTLRTDDQRERDLGIYSNFSREIGPILKRIACFECFKVGIKEVNRRIRSRKSS